MKCSELKVGGDLVEGLSKGRRLVSPIYCLLHLVQ